MKNALSYQTLLIGAVLILACSVFVIQESFAEEENFCHNQSSLFTPFELQYSFDGIVTVENICLTDYGSIVVYVNGTINSSITISIPKNIGCWLFGTQYDENDLIVLINGEEVNVGKIMMKNNSLDITVNVKDGINEIEFVGMAMTLMEHTSYCLSPKLQQHIGIDLNYITCKRELELIFKSKDNSPACVTPDTSLKLITRGWGEKYQSKIWVVSTLTQCGDPWDQYGAHMDHAYKITSYYENRGIEIHDMITVSDPKLTSICEACGCSSGVTLFLLIDEWDTERMLNSGFNIAEGNTTKQTVSNQNKPKPLD